MLVWHTTFCMQKQIRYRQACRQASPPWPVCVPGCLYTNNFYQRSGPLLKCVSMETLWGSHSETENLTALITSSSLLCLSSCRLMQRWELVDIFDYHTHDVFLMVLTSQLSALTAGNRTTHSHLYFLFRYESSYTAAEMMNQTLTFVSTELSCELQTKTHYHEITR